MVGYLLYRSQEPEEISDSGESSFSRFGSVLQAALQGIESECI